MNNNNGCLVQKVLINNVKNYRWIYHRVVNKSLHCRKKMTHFSFEIHLKCYMYIRDPRDKERKEHSMSKKKVSLASTAVTVQYEYTITSFLTCIHSILRMIFFFFQSWILTDMPRDFHTLCRK